MFKMQPVIQYIDKMIIDENLSNLDKIELLRGWKDTLYLKIERTILHNEELRKVNNCIAYMNEKIKDLKSTTQTPKVRR